MRVVTLIVIILVTRECYSTCDKHDGGCCYPTVDEPQPQPQPQPQNVTCPPIKYGTIGWSVQESGRLNIIFALPTVNCRQITCFELTLLVDESLNEEGCAAKNTEMEQGPHRIPVEKEFKHSQKIYLITNGCHAEKNGYQTCEATGVMSFNFVFTGCYQVAIQPRINSSTSIRMHSPTKYLRTNYIKSIIAGPRHTNVSRINVTDRYYPALHRTQVTVAFSQLIYNHLHMEINFMENIDIFHEEACYKTGQQHSCCLIVNNTARECSSPMPVRNYPPAQCTVLNGSISCYFSEVDPGDYCFTMHVVVDDRCESDTLWTKPRNDLDCPQPHRSCSLTCSWQHNFTAAPAMTLPISGVVENDWESSHFYIILATAMTAVVAVTVVFLLLLRAYTRRYYPRPPPAVFRSPAIPLEVEPCRIFLLYARDCQPFMELMATLRELLEGATKCEVIDCLDPSRWNDIGRSPVEWVRTHIEHPNTKVMLVATPCGQLRQQGHLNQTLTYYKKPDTYDNLFTYGLKTLTDNLSQDIYRKICVVRFEGFSDDGNLFSHLTPYTRFVLPLHLHQLILTLQPSVTADEDVTLVEDKEVQKLCQDLTNLISYKNTNVNYLQDMLIVQRNDVN